MANNVLLTISENQKILIFDYTECLGAPSQQQDITIDETKLLQSQLKFMYDNKFRINATDVVYTEMDPDTSTYVYKTNMHTMIKDHLVFNPVITFSVETFDNIDECGGEFSIEISITPYDRLILYFVDRVIPQYKVYNKQCHTINANIESFMLVRTNPKLTGNIKLVVTEDYNLYLDTFKVSKTSLLNKTEYRHKAIPDDGNYPYDVYRAFRSVPKGEMYRIYDDSYDAHKNYYDPDLQIENIYEYGAEYNKDKLYTENMKILAPLYIGKTVPTYFAIFKTDNLINKSGFDNTELFNEMMQQAKCVKIYDLRQSTSIGKYLNNYKSMITKYLAGTCSLQFIEQDNSSTSINYRQGRNTWKGIAYDKGIFADMTETSYFANQILQGTSQVQEKYNMFLLNGYSRNNILYPNIINLEFMFNDENADDLSMHNYFGLYLTENDFMTFNQVISRYSKDGNTDLTYYDENNDVVNINDTKLKILDNDEYASRIFFGTTLSDAKYLKSSNDFNSFIINNVVNKPYENLVSVSGNEIKLECNSFMTLTFTQQIHYGEHFKFIDITDNVVYEVVGSNDINLLGFKNQISQYVNSNIENNIKIFRVTFYTQDENDASVPAALDIQIKRLTAAIGKFKECITAANYNENTLSVTSDKVNIYFQHILADVITDETIQDTICYFNMNNIYDCHILSDKPLKYTQKYQLFSNNKFENYGEQYTNIVRFINTRELNQTYELSYNVYKEIEHVAVPLVSTKNGYYPITQMSISNYKLSFTDAVGSSKLNRTDTCNNCVISPYDVNKCIISSLYSIKVFNDTINICSPVKTSVALMGISQIKDFDMYVNVNEYYQNESVIKTSFEAGETVMTDDSDNRLHKYITYKLVSGHIQGLPINANDKFVITCDDVYYTVNGTVMNQRIVEESLTFDTDSVIELAYTGAFDKYSYNVYKPYIAEDNFYIDPSDTVNSNLEIPLVPAVNCQWRSNGTYFDTLSTMNTNTFNNYSIVGNFIENVYMPDKHNNQYISSRLKDIIQTDDTKMTVKDFITKYGYANALRKYLSYDFKIDTAIGYYNSYVNSLEFIYYGIKFIFKLTNTQYANEIKLNEYNNYEVFIINDYNSLNKNEIYISKNEEFILIINHTYKACPQYVNGGIKIMNTDIIDSPYTWYDAPYNYELIHTSYLNNILSIQKSNYYELTDNVNIKYTIEVDLKQYDWFDEDNVYFYINMTDSSVFDTYDNFKLNSASFLFGVNKKDDDLSTYTNNVYYLTERYIDIPIDFREKHTYVVKKNPSVQLSYTYEEKLNNYIDSFDADIELNIINGSECQTLNITDTYKPLTLTMQRPNQIKFNPGLFDPNFVDIFEYQTVDEISDILNIDTLYANTLVKQVKQIRNMYYNKVMNANQKCVYNYFCKSYHSPLATAWDDDIYRLYDDDINYNDTYGYIIGINDKMMFGSKCLVTHSDEMYITDWNYTGNNNGAVFMSSKNNVNGIVQNTLVMTLNVTDAFYNMLIQIPEFRSNWDNIGAVNNVNVYINNYINNTLSKIYDIANPEIQLYGMYDAKLVNVNPSKYFIKEKPADIDKYTLINNANTQYNNVNNKILMTVTIQNYNNMKFYPMLKINKI